MAQSVKIRQLLVPEGDLGNFDPGAFLSGLEFYETDDPVADDDRDGLAQFAHFLAFLALNNQSTAWPESSIDPSSSAFLALESHFVHLDGWADIVTRDGIPYRSLASFLMPHYPPRQP
jgi:hypothetical protein